VKGKRRGWSECIFGERKGIPVPRVARAILRADMQGDRTTEFGEGLSTVFGVDREEVSIAHVGCLPPASIVDLVFEIPGYPADSSSRTQHTRERSFPRHSKHSIFTLRLASFRSWKGCRVGHRLHSVGPRRAKTVMLK
jgi:hypothetical protein